jgi:heme oxygenase
MNPMDRQLPNDTQDLLSALRNATEGAHRKLEQQALSLMMMSVDHVPTVYPFWLEALAPELCILESMARSALTGTDWESLLPEFVLAECLGQDLRAMERSVTVLAPASERVATLGEGVGALYVITGSQLGARLLLRRLDAADPGNSLPRDYLRASAAADRWLPLSRRLHDQAKAAWTPSSCAVACTAFKRMSAALVRARHEQSTMIREVGEPIPGEREA